MGSTSGVRWGFCRRIAARIGRVRILVPALALVLAIGCSSGTARGPGAVDSGEAPPLRVATSGDYAPFSVWQSGEVEPQGFSTDVARAYARDRGQRIEWIRFRWPELAAEIEAGRFDLALSGITIRPDRSLAGRFSLPLTRTGAVALVGAQSPLRTPMDLDRPGIRIAVNRGGHLERVARTLFPNARVEAVADNAGVPERLASARADAVLTDDLEAPHWQALLPGSRAIGPFTRDRKAAYFPAGHPERVREFDRWLLRVERSGELARLRRRHGLDDARTAAPLPALLASLDERLSLMPAVARAKQVLALPIEDRAQEERVHVAAGESVAAAAREFAVEAPPPVALRRFIDATLHAARFLQERELAELDHTPPSPGDALLPDAASARSELDTRVRPAIAAISERIAWLLIATSSARADADVRGSDPGLTLEAVSAALVDRALPAEIEVELHASLAALLKPARRAREAAPANP